MKLGWGPWIYGLTRGAISGGATSVVSSFGAMGIDNQHFNLSSGLSHTLELFGVMFAVNAVYRTLEYLKDHPLPDMIPDPPK